MKNKRAISGEVVLTIGKIMIVAFFLLLFIIILKAAGYWFESETEAAYIFIPLIWNLKRRY